MVGRRTDPLSLGFCLSPSYAIIRCRLEILSASLRLLNLGIRSASPSNRTISKNTAAIDIPTTCLVVKPFFFCPEFDFTAADGASAIFGGVRPVAGPQNGGAGLAGGGFNGDEGGGSGAVVALNGFPSFLHSQLSLLVNRCTN